MSGGNGNRTILSAPIDIISLVSLFSRAEFGNFPISTYIHNSKYIYLVLKSTRLAWNVKHWISIDVGAKCEFYWKVSMFDNSLIYWWPGFGCLLIQFYMGDLLLCRCWIVKSQTLIRWYCGNNLLSQHGSHSWIYDNNWRTGNSNGRGLVEEYLVPLWLSSVTCRVASGIRLRSRLDVIKVIKTCSS